MSILVRKGTAGAARAITAQYNLLRQTVAKISLQFHADVTSLGTTGDWSNPVAASITSTIPAAATDLPTCQTLANALQAMLAIHAADAVASLYANAGSHLVADATNAPTLAAIALATNLATTQTLANGLKAFLNAHYTQAGVHVNNDGTNTIAAAAASDLATSITLLNACRTAVIAHIASAPAGLALKLVDP